MNKLAENKETSSYDKVTEAYAEPMKKDLRNRDRRTLLATLFVWIGLALAISRAEQVYPTEANVVTELAFTANRTYVDPANEVTLDVIFNSPTGQKLRVPAFWAGKNVWKARYSSPVFGTHTFQSECANKEDAGLNGITGKVEVKPYTGQNQLYAHGPLRVTSDRRHLEHADGTPFFWLADTWWMGLCHRIQFPDEFQTLAADRKAKGFNVIQIVAGLYPDMPPFDPRGANEAGLPWEENYARIRPEYFDAADRRIQYLIDQGFTPCIVGAWGYFASFMGVEKAKQHWRYLVARYGALPVVWCAAGEANLPYYQAKGFPYDDRKQVEAWTEVTRYLRQIDSFHRLITIHPTGIGRLSARNAINDLSLIDFDMLQTPHGEREAVQPTIRTVRESYNDTPVMPVINGEAAYEMLNDRITAQWSRAMFWVCMMNGAAGHTYGANGIWQCNRKGQPHGPSPTAGSPPTGYGAISWDHAMNLPGSGQIGLGKKLLEQYRWWNFEPHPEWAERVRKPLPNLEGCNWIWFPEGNPAQDAPTEKRYFRKSFVLPTDKAIESAGLRISVDDGFSASINGEALGTGGSWKAPGLTDVSHLLKPGSNVLAILAENLPANVPANPAGLLACLEVRFASGETMRITSNATWLCTKNEVSGWNRVDFDSTGWTQAQSLGNYGSAPWGRLDDAADQKVGPQSAGIPGVVRVIYALESDPVVVHHLEAGTTYAALYFDPVTGAKTPISSVQGDATGSWTCKPPAGTNHDWLLILEAQPRTGVLR